MPVPEATSAEAFERYVGGQCLRTSRGEAWCEIKACIIALPRHFDTSLSAVSEPFLAWTMSGEVEFQERGQRAMDQPSAPERIFLSHVGQQRPSWRLPSRSATRIPVISPSSSAGKRGFLSAIIVASDKPWHV